MTEESKKIIIVEDEALIAVELKSTLEMLGYSVVGHAMNGDKALDLFATRAADLIILDINLKGTLDGLDLAKIVRERYNVPFVFLTSFSDSYTISKVKDLRPYGYIVKPFTDNDLKVTIALALFNFNEEQEKEDFSKRHAEAHLGLELTDREYEILEAFRDGKTYKETASSLFLSVNTVKHYQKKLFQRLEVSSKYELLTRLNSKP